MIWMIIKSYATLVKFGNLDTVIADGEEIYMPFFDLKFWGKVRGKEQVREKENLKEYKILIQIL